MQRRDVGLKIKCDVSKEEKKVKYIMAILFVAAIVFAVLMSFSALIGDIKLCSIFSAGMSSSVIVLLNLSRKRVLGEFDIIQLFWLVCAIVALIASVLCISNDYPTTCVVMSGFVVLGITAAVSYK